MSNKLVQQQLKNTVRGLSGPALETVLANYEVVSGCAFEKTCRMTSYKCYEACVISESKKVNGYGRNEQEALTNCIKNIFESLMEDESKIPLVRQALKNEQKTSSALTNQQQNQERSSQKQIPNPNRIPNPSKIQPIRESIQFTNGLHSRSGSNQRTDKVNSTLALNLSQQQGDSSFDMRGDIEALSKNIGNISTITYSKFVDTQNASQLEMDDLILKAMLDNPEKAKYGMEERHDCYGGNTSNNDGHSNNAGHTKPGIRSRSPLAETQNTRTESSSHQNLNKKRENDLNVSNTTAKDLRERERASIPSSNSQMLKKPAYEPSSAIQITATYSSNTNVSAEKSRPRLSYQPIPSKSESNISINKENKLEPYDLYESQHRQNKSQQKQTNELDISSDILDHNHQSTHSKASTYQQYRDNLQKQHSNTSLTQSRSTCVPSMSKIEKSDRPCETTAKCNCEAAEGLAKAQQKIEEMEKRMKQLIEENRMLKSLVSENNSVPAPSMSPLKTYSCYQGYNPEKSYSQLQQSIYVSTQPDASDKSQDHIEKQSNTPNGNEKIRSQSVDVYAKRKGMLNSDISTIPSSCVKETPNPRRGAKNIIPKLRLELLPNYHLNKKTTPEVQAILHPKPHHTSSSTTHSISFSKLAPQGSSSTNAFANPTNSFMQSQISAHNSSLAKLLKK